MVQQVGPHFKVTIMAISQDTIDERFGYLVPNAYIKLAYFRWSDADMKAMATFSIFATSTAMAEGKEVITNIEIDVTNQFLDIQPLLYAEIKKLPEYSDAVDV